MRRLLLLILYLSTMWTAQGQVAYDWRYWFDQSPTYEQGSSEGTLHLDVDVSGLSKTLHQIYLQVRDTAGIFSEPVSKYFVVPDDGHGSSKLHYWFDQSNADLHVVDLGNGMFDLDVSHLNSGFHTLHFQVSDALGIVSNPQNKMFYIPEIGEGKNKLYYWVDENSQNLTTTDIQDNMTLDFSHLESGYHTLHFIATDKYGATSEPMHRGFIRATDVQALKWRYWFDDELDKSVVMSPMVTSVMIDVDSLADGLHYIHLQAMNDHFSEAKTQMFIKVPKTVDLDEMYCLVLIDNMLHSKETINMKNGGMATLNLDVKELSQGLHKLDVMVMTPSGALSTAYNSYFIRGYLGDDRGVLRCLYAFDDEADLHEATYSEGMSHLSIDVAHLKNGPHTVRWMLADKEGAYVSDKRSWFIKLPLGGNTVSKYCYWLNDADSEKHVKVLTESKNPYDLIALLPVETMPLRSSCFHLENKDNQPMMYAKNDIHFTFTDRFDRETNISKQYVDYNTSASITDVAQLKQTQAFTRPEENGIKWFKFEAAPGDTIGFKSSQATTIQVFAPSGKEILSAMGDKSVQYTGAHTWEKGTYYVAVHDVTGSKPNITLDYMHMDKYDIVSQDVHVIGNGGCSTITFQGNGFRDLYAVDLKDLNGNIIESINVGHESDASTTVTFDFTGATLGKYNAVFHFTLDDKTVANCITVEEAKDIELATKVSYPSTFLRGTSVTYTVEITNKGNMTAYTVPVDLRIITDRFDNISKIHFGDALTSISMPENLDLDSLEQEEIDMIKEVINSADDRCQFIVVNDTVNHKDYGFAQIIATIAPNTTQKLQITIQSSSSVALMAYTTKNWFSVSATESTIRKVKSAKAPSNNSICCMKEQFQCAADIIASFGEMLGAAIPGVAGGNINCGTAVATTTVSLAFDIGCSDGENINERIRNYAKSNAGSLANKLISTLVSCVTGYYKPILSSLYESKKIALALKNWNEVERIRAQISRVRTALNGSLVRIYKGVNSGISGVNCFTLSADPIPGCPPNPGGGGGSSSPVNSYDPNDIYGYIAPFGSIFVGNDVVNLPYRIEFENDTTFATSAAHMVVVTDTLDAKVFDLSSYKPTSIKIGDKSVQLKGDKTFVTTVDMRPEINAIAQVEGLYDEKRGIAIWQFTSLDPMTMEPTDDIMQGFLPVNYDGVSGIGEVSFNINRKADLVDGTEIPNRASIVFDANDPILTPTWVNTVDAVCPESSITNVIQHNDSIISIYFEGDDERSEIWKYELYVQYGKGSSWIKFAECGADSSHVDFRYYDGIDYGFCVLATDSAGNVEKKEFTREGTFVIVNIGDVNSDGEINTLDASLTTGYYLEQPVYILAIAADVNGDGEINTLDATQITQMYLNNLSPDTKVIKSRQRLIDNKTTEQ